MADFEYSSYNYVDNTGFWGAPQQITWHIDRFRDKHEEMMSAQTMMIEVKFDALIQGLKDIFTGKQEGTQNDESYYDMVQRESTETQNLYRSESNESQSAFTKYHNMMETELGKVETAIDNNTTRVYGAISANTQSTSNAINAQTNSINSSISGQTNSINGSITSQTNTLTGTTYNSRIANWPEP